MRIRITFSPKHPDGAVWAEGKHGWEHLPGADLSVMGLPLDGVNYMEAEMHVQNDVLERLYESAGEAVTVLPSSDECKTCD